MRASKTDYLYDIDEHPPLSLALLYGLQWAFVMFPALIIAATLASGSLNLTNSGQIRFLQLTLLIPGFFTAVQTLWGHHYPLLEGPSTALLLAFVLAAPDGLPAIQGGMMIGGGLMVALVLSRQIERVSTLFTPNVTGVVLILIALGLLPTLLRFMAGQGVDHEGGTTINLTLSFLCVLLMATLSYRLKGIWKSLSVLIGMAVGSGAFWALGHLSSKAVGLAAWFSLPGTWIPSMPDFHWPTVLAFVFAYLAVMVNSVGSLESVARITDQGRLETGLKRGILINGLAGMVCGATGIVGSVSYSNSPGVILMHRVASRYTITYCGLIMVIAAFIPKLAAVLAMVPGPVVGAALCVAMGGQIGIGMAAMGLAELTSRDYFVIGIPLLMGTMAGFLPQNVTLALPDYLRAVLSNSLVAGIILVLLLEHVLLRKRS
jgi:xanthine/uracil permease